LPTKGQVATRLYIRRGLSEPEAALYIGLGSTKFRELVKQGRAPRPRSIDSRRLWDIDDVDAFFKSLPTEGEEPAEE
jgi:predicted DNA-binding transcriptional regulator AlpA